MKIADIVLLDIYEGFAKGKALDMSQNANVLNYDGEPDANVAFTVTHFWEMVKPTFGPLNDFHMKAIYKRCITLLICKHRVVLRLPNEDLEAECVTEYKEDDAHKDTLIDTNKLYLDKLRLGEHVKYPNYDLKVSEEVAWAEEQIKAEKRFDVPLNFRSIEAQQPQQPQQQCRWRQR